MTGAAALAAALALALSIALLCARRIGTALATIPAQRRIAPPTRAVTGMPNTRSSAPVTRKK